MTATIGPFQRFPTTLYGLPLVSLRVIQEDGFAGYPLSTESALLLPNQPHISLREVELSFADSYAILTPSLATLLPNLTDLTCSGNLRQPSMKELQAIPRTLRKLALLNEQEKRVATLPLHSDIFDQLLPPCLESLNIDCIALMASVQQKQVRWPKGLTHLRWYSSGPATLLSHLPKGLLILDAVLPRSNWRIRMPISMLPNSLTELRLAPYEIQMNVPMPPNMRRWSATLDTAHLSGLHPLPKTLTYFQHDCRWEHILGQDPQWSRLLPNLTDLTFPGQSFGDAFPEMVPYGSLKRWQTDLPGEAASQLATLVPNLNYLILDTENSSLGHIAWPPFLTYLNLLTTRDLEAPQFTKKLPPTLTTLKCLLALIQAPECLSSLPKGLKAIEFYEADSDNTGKWQNGFRELPLGIESVTLSDDSMEPYWIDWTSLRFHKQLKTLIVTYRSPHVTPEIPSESWFQLLPPSLTHLQIPSHFGRKTHPAISEQFFASLPKLKVYQIWNFPGLTGTHLSFLPHSLRYLLFGEALKGLKPGDFVHLPKKIIRFEGPIDWDSMALEEFINYDSRWKGFHPKQIET
jgi:hypothetical protein